MTIDYQKNVLILVRRDPVEAMRVAAGVSIFDHRVNIVLAHGQLQITDDVVKGAELLEISEIDVYSLADDPEVPKIEQNDLLTLIKEAHFVLTL